MERSSFALCRPAERKHQQHTHDKKKYVSMRFVRHEQSACRNIRQTHQMKLLKGKEERYSRKQKQTNGSSKGTSVARV
jgi:hypothetical protein